MLFKQPVGHDGAVPGIPVLPDVPVDEGPVLDKGPHCLPHVDVGERYEYFRSRGGQLPDLPQKVKRVFKMLDEFERDYVVVFPVDKLPGEIAVQVYFYEVPRTVKALTPYVARRSLEARVREALGQSP